MGETYTGVQKAAILLITLGPEKAATIFKHLKEDEIEELTLEIARVIHLGFLQQNAFTDIDGYSSYDRQEKLLAIILSYDKLCRDAIAKGASAVKLFEIPARERIGRAKSVPVEEYPQVYNQIQAEMEQQIEAVAAQGGEL